MYRTLILILAASTCTATASAHHLWLEPADNGTPMLRFGEYAQNLREASPGRVDQLAGPTFTVLTEQGKQAVGGEKIPSGFALPTSVSTRQAILAEERHFPLRRITQEGKQIIQWYYPAARWIPDFARREPQLTLDLVPVGQSGVFTLFFKGKPLAKSKVTLLTQSGWGQQLYTDEQGQVSFTLPWSGQYVAEVKHVDFSAGKRGEEGYDQVIYVTTASFRKVDGLIPIPAGPVKPPKR